MYKRVFDIHAWKLSTHAFNEGDIRLYESLTSIGNGYMGMRGNFEEGFSGDSHTGTYIAGIWFPDKTRVGWWKNGYPKYFGKVINAVNFAAREFGRYIEIFGGSGAVLLGKEPSKFEVYNDIEGELVNFFRVVKNRPAELLLELDLLPLNSREEFASWLHFHDGGNEPTIHLPDQLEIIDSTTPAYLLNEAEKLKTSLRKRSDYRDVRQAAAYLMRVRNSYSSSGRSFACQPFSVRTLFAQIWEMSRRLENV